MRDLEERLRAELGRDTPEPAVGASDVLAHVYARQRASIVRRTVAAASLAVAVAIGVPVVVAGTGDDPVNLPPPATQPATTPPASTPHVPLGNPPPRTTAFPGVPSYLTITDTPPDPPHRMPTGAATRFWVGDAGSPVAGLVWVRQPSEPFGLPGTVVELPRGIGGDTRALVTDDPGKDVTHMRTYDPSGDQDFVLVHGGDTSARLQVIRSILAGLR
ncbi:hypothetical protein [Asanoa siamensis]|uniref:DUF4367 domain-containing protein n=1 Tax=Asanoa siamensis TaxID=926357 RepID=A0ABQ4CK42_9ACTN|nr:hypothetical protein [Asanoa siamensis]GIF71654.1 hypothetical protein Asi02nite_11720 [Asanoa siamensis]